MNITKDTTDADLFYPITRTRKALAEMAASDMRDSEYLSNAVNSVARAEGVAEVNYLLRNALAAGATVEEIERTLLQCALRSADDTYSGRNNDARRSKRDGLVERVKELTQFNGIARIVDHGDHKTGCQA